MGTNYYHVEKPCSECGRREEIHIGKSSFGWSFNFRAYPNLETKAKWERCLREGLHEGSVVKDEYGDVVPLEDFLSLVESKQVYRKTTDVEYGLDGYVDDDGYAFIDREFG